MIKRTALAVLGLVAVCSPLVAQPDDFVTLATDSLPLSGEVELAPALALNRPDLFSNMNGNLLIHGLPVTTFLNGRRLLLGGSSNPLGVSALDQIPLAFLSTVRVLPTSTYPSYATDAPGGIVDLRLRQTSGGEVGAFYGASGGKNGREDFSAYILGGVGTEKFQISAGAAYENSSFRSRTLSH